MQDILKGLRLPVMLAPMAGVSTPKLVGKASKHGILGMHGGGFRNALDLGRDIDEIRCITDRPFGINIFVTDPVDGESAEARARIDNARKRLTPLYDKFGLQVPSVEAVQSPVRLYEEQIQVLLEKKVPLISFCFGVMEPELIAKFQRSGTFVVGTATSVEEACYLESVGVDAIVAQGSEAGGHRGSFLPNASSVGLMSLLPQISDAVRNSIPIIAAGGIMDGRGLKAALALGAQGVSMGTAFITCDESEASELHKRTILNANETDSVITDVFSGRSARGYYNQFAQTYDKKGRNHNKQQVLEQLDNVAPYPIQQSLTNPLKAASVKAQDPENSSLWFGQSPRLAKREPIDAILSRMEDQSK